MALVFKLGLFFTYKLYIFCFINTLSYGMIFKQGFVSCRWKGSIPMDWIKGHKSPSWLQVDSERLKIISLVRYRIHGSRYRIKMNEETSNYFQFAFKLTARISEYGGCHLATNANKIISKVQSLQNELVTFRSLVFLLCFLSWALGVKASSRGCVVL